MDALDIRRAPECVMRQERLALAPLLAKVMILTSTQFSYVLEIRCPIIHNQDFDLSGDPQPATPPGIGYAFYDCEPTIGGPDLATILTDPCINTTSPIIVGGMPSTSNKWGLDCIRRNKWEPHPCK